MVVTEQLTFSTRGHTDIIDLTQQVKEKVRRADFKEGLVTLFAIGSTGALTTIEHESGLLKDLTSLVEKLVPQKGSYVHNATWGDDNGHSHLRASLFGPSLSIPIVGGDLVLGTWQQIVFIDFDVRPREREVMVQLVGE